MRVLHILPDLAAGGAERLVLAHALDRADVAVATVFGGGDLESRFAPLGPLLGERRAGRPSARAFRQLVAAAKRADVVHTHLFAGNLWGGLAARLARRPHVAHEHNTDRDESAHTRAVRRAMAGWPHLTLAVSEAAARHSFARVVEVVENGVDLSGFTEPWRGGGGLLAVGRRTPQKGFDVLLNALPAQAKLRVAGVGPFAPIHPQVEWLGLRDDVPSLLAAADILVVPSRWEGFGLAALEGLAAGTPVVASAVDGLANVVGDAGILVPPGDSSALRHAIELVLANDGLREDLSSRGRVRSRRYDQSRTFNQWDAAHRAAGSTSPA